MEERCKRASTLRLRHSRCLANLRQRPNRANLRSRALGQDDEAFVLIRRLTISTLRRAGTRFSRGRARWREPWPKLRFPSPLYQTERTDFPHPTGFISRPGPKFSALASNTAHLKFPPSTCSRESRFMPRPCTLCRLEVPRAVEGMSINRLRKPMRGCHRKSTHANRPGGGSIAFELQVNSPCCPWSAARQPWP
jgi:hypothetical protein